MIQQYESLPQLIADLTDNGCTACPLGKQRNPHGPVVHRGALDARVMVVGEAPGAMEVPEKKPFMGPAGKLLDKIMKSVGISTETDMYLTNTVLCRPIAGRDTGRQNLTPTREVIDTCHGLLAQQINFIKPAVVVLTGMTAARSVLREIVAEKSMFDLAGEIHESPEFPGVKFYSMYHPSSLLHAESDPVRHSYLKQKMWDHVQKLKSILTEEGIETNATTAHTTQPGDDEGDSVSA